MRRNDGWCEDPRHGRYNRPIRLPSAAGHETMWRDDRLYDVVGVLDWNFRRASAAAAARSSCTSAARAIAPTAGCIALDRRDLKLLLAAVGRRSRFLVAAKPRRRVVHGG